jgi:hypothetical protein
MIFGHVRWEANGTGYRKLVIHLNSGNPVAYVTGAAIFSGADYQTIMTHYELQAGDYVQLLAQQTSGGPLKVVVEPSAMVSPEFGMVKLP